MFHTLKQRLLLGVYIFILLSIPVGAYLASQNQTYKGSANEGKTNKPITEAKTSTSGDTGTSPAKQLLDSVTGGQDSSPEASSSSSPTIANAYGPTLSLKAILEGRPSGNQETKLFVGIIEGNLIINPKFLLSFSVDLPATGEYSGLSLAGLNSGSVYTALLKGPAQIATSSAFTMTPNITVLNEGQPINLLSGDLNEDNVINSADYSLVQKAMGSSANSGNWNENADFNRDGVINTFDLRIIAKNIGQTGASGAWTSPVPKVATSSAGLTQPAVGGPIDNPGHWIWIPSL